MVCAYAFGGAALLMGSVMCTGFLTFGASSQAKPHPSGGGGEGLEVEWMGETCWA